MRLLNYNQIVVTFCLVGSFLTSCNKTVSKSGMKGDKHPQEQPLPKELMQGIINNIHKIYPKSIDAFCSIKELHHPILLAIEKYKAMCNKCIICRKSCARLAHSPRDGLVGSCRSCTLFFKRRHSPSFGYSPEDWSEHCEECPKSKGPCTEKEEESYINISKEDHEPQSPCPRCRYEKCCEIYRNSMALM